MKSLQYARHLVLVSAGNCSPRRLSFCILLIGLFIAPIAASAETLSAERKEAAALLKRLEKYEQKYIEQEAQAPRVQTSKKSNDVYNQQQERLVGEILSLRKKVQRLESEAEQEIDKTDFSARETELIDEIRRERVRAEKFEKDLVDYKRKETQEVILKRALSDQQGELEIERQRSKKKDKSIQELKKTVEMLQAKVQQAEQVKQQFSSTQRSAQQLQLRVESQKNVESDNLFLRNELQKLKRKLAKVQARREGSGSVEKVGKLQSKIEAADEQLLALTRSNKQLKDQLNEAKVDLEKSRQMLIKSSTVESGLRESQQSLIGLRKELETERDRGLRLTAELNSYKEQLAAKEEKESTLTSTLKATADQARGSVSQLEAAKTKLLHLERELAQAQQTVATQQEQLANLSKAEGELATINMSLNNEKLRAEQCEMQVSGLQSSSERVRELEQQLLAAQNELLLKNTAMEVLGKGPSPKQRRIRAKMSSIAESQTQGGKPLDNRSMQTKRIFEAAQNTLRQASDTPASVVAATTSNGVLIVEVQSQKVNLRSGPGVEHSPVMQVAQGTRLTVESRQGDWYRVFTPTGGRAFVRQDMVQGMAGEAPMMVPTPSVPRAIGNGPNKPVARGIQSPTALVPFGKVKVAGNPSKDLEDAALEALRGIGQKSDSQ